VSARDEFDLPKQASRETLGFISSEFSKVYLLWTNMLSEVDEKELPFDLMTGATTLGEQMLEYSQVIVKHARAYGYDGPDIAMPEDGYDLDR
jgi:hypothetical protein